MKPCPRCHSRTPTAGCPICGGPTDQLLTERERTHGNYSDHARVTQMLKRVMHAERSFVLLSPEARESLDMMANKIGRILAGNPHHADHWDDIAGYARLVSQRLARPE